MIDISTSYDSDFFLRNHQTHVLSMFYSWLTFQLTRSPRAGVTEAVYSYLRSPEPHLLPFLMYTNKLLFTTPSHHQFYMDLIKSHPYFGKTTSFAPQRTKMLGTGFRLGPSGQGRDMDKERKAWVDYLKSLKE